MPTYLLFFFFAKQNDFYFIVFFNTENIQLRIFGMNSVKPGKMYLFYDSLNRNYALYHFPVAECT